MPYNPAVQTFDTFVGMEKTVKIFRGFVNASITPKILALSSVGDGLGKTHLARASAQAINNGRYFDSAQQFMAACAAIDTNMQYMPSHPLICIDDLGTLAPEQDSAFTGILRKRHEADLRTLLVHPTNQGWPATVPRTAAILSWGVRVVVGESTKELRDALVDRIIADELNRQLSQEERTLLYTTVAGMNVRNVIQVMITFCAREKTNNIDDAIAELVQTQPTVTEAICYMMGHVVDVVAEVTNVTQQEILGKSRSRHIVRARHLAIYAAKRLNHRLTLDDIGAHFGNRDHSTILHAINKITQAMYHDAVEHTRVERLVQTIRNSAVNI